MSQTASLNHFYLVSQSLNNGLQRKGYSTGPVQMLILRLEHKALFLQRSYGDLSGVERSTHEMS